MGPALIVASIFAVYLYLKGDSNAVPNILFQRGLQPGITTGTGSQAAVSGSPDSINNSGVVTNQPGTSGSGVPSSSVVTRPFANYEPGYSIRSNQPYYGTGRLARGFVPAARPVPTSNGSGGCGCGGTQNYPLGNGGCGQHQDGRGGCASAPSSPCGCGGLAGNQVAGRPREAPLTINGQAQNLGNFASTGASPFNAWQQALAEFDISENGVPAAPTYIH